jgi:hypothetical protein
MKKYKIEIEINTNKGIKSVREYFTNLIEDMCVGGEIDSFYTVNVENKL